MQSDFISGCVCACCVPGVAHPVIHFPVYELLKDVLTERRRRDGIAGQPPPVPSPLDLLAASIVSKVIASGATYPHEVIRSRQQVWCLCDAAGVAWSSLMIPWSGDS